MKEFIERGRHIKKQVPALLILSGMLIFVLFCNPAEPRIERIRADKPSLAPGESTMLYCDVYNPAGIELTYLWQADAGKIEDFGASARWTAPAAVTSDTLVTITVTVSDQEGWIDQETIPLEVKTTP